MVNNALQYFLNDSCRQERPLQYLLVSVLSGCCWPFWKKWASDGMNSVFVFLPLLPSKWLAVIYSWNKLTTAFMPPKLSLCLARLEKSSLSKGSPNSCVAGTLVRLVLWSQWKSGKFAHLVVPGESPQGISVMCFSWQASACRGKPSLG